MQLRFDRLLIWPLVSGSSTSWSHGLPLSNEVQVSYCEVLYSTVSKAGPQQRRRFDTSVPSRRLTERINGLRVPEEPYLHTVSPAKCPHDVRRPGTGGREKTSISDGSDIHRREFDVRKRGEKTLGRVRDRRWVESCRGPVLFCARRTKFQCTLP